MKRLSQRINFFFSRYEAPWEIFMIFLAVIFVVLGFLPEMIKHMSPGAFHLLLTVDWVITGIFIAEFTLRISVAPSRKAYLKNHWIDLVAIMPWTRFFRLARLARLARLLRLLILIRAFGGWEAFLSQVKAVLRQNNFIWFLLAMVALIMITSAVALWQEGRVNPTMTNYASALWWAVSTISTVGYGDVYPVTSIGRLMGVVIIVLGLAFWGMLIGTISAYLTALVARGSKSKKTDPAIEELKSKLERLDNLSEKELITLQGAVDALILKCLGSKKTK